MSDTPGGSGRSSTRKGREEPRDGQRVRRFVRHAHIFSSTVRELLELKLLRQSTTLPLTVSQFHVLRLMSLNGRHQVGEVADFLGVSAPAATRNIDKLERLGLMERHPSEGDRRATLLAASERGRALVRKYDESLDRRLDSVLAGFGPAEMDRLSGLLERFFISLLKTEPNGRPDGICLRCAAYLEAGCPVGHLRGGCPYRERGAGGDPGAPAGPKRRVEQPGRPGPRRRGPAGLRSFS